MFISRKELQELREEISKLSLKVDSQKSNSRFWIFDDPSPGCIYSSGQTLSHSEAINLLAKHVGVRFKCQRGPGDHAVLESIEVTK
jgi:hypothetical protein